VTRIYTGTLTAPPDGPAPLPQSDADKATLPGGYQPDPGLVDAVNVALLLGQPLLLTGEPGTGKTQLSYNVAFELGAPDPLRFDAKSTSAARDLFYVFDAVGHFRAAQTGEGRADALHYISWTALGRAILHSMPPEVTAELLPDDDKHTEAHRSVVLIDEVDKAPRDFPNDILSEIENMRFTVPELGGRTFSVDPALRPVVIITSNSEKALPDAFLRRCVYYDIRFPDEERLRGILERRLDAWGALGASITDVDAGFLTDALSLFWRLRQDRTGLQKKPATAELIGWLLALRKLFPDAANPLNRRVDGARDVEPATKALSVLVKRREDVERARAATLDWVRERDQEA